MTKRRILSITGAVVSTATLVIGSVIGSTVVSNAGTPEPQQTPPPTDGGDVLYELTKPVAEWNATAIRERAQEHTAPDSPARAGLLALANKAEAEADAGIIKNRNAHPYRFFDGDGAVSCPYKPQDVVSGKHQLPNLCQTTMHSAQLDDQGRVVNMILCGKPADELASAQSDSDKNERAQVTYRTVLGNYYSLEVENPVGEDPIGKDELEFQLDADDLDIAEPSEVVGAETIPSGESRTYSVSWPLLLEDARGSTISVAPVDLEVQVQ